MIKCTYFDIDTIRIVYADFSGEITKEAAEAWADFVMEHGKRPERKGIIVTNQQPELKELGTKAMIEITADFKKKLKLAFAGTTTKSNVLQKWLISAVTMFTGLQTVIYFQGDDKTPNEIIHLLSDYLRLNGMPGKDMEIKQIFTDPFSYAPQNIAVFGGASV